MGNPLLVNIAELSRRPGSEKEFGVDLTVADLGIDDPRFAAGAPVHVAVTLESLLDGVVVDGEVVSTWRGECRRCLRPIDGELRGPVHELYQREVTADDAFPIVGEQLDLREMVREVLLIDAPVVPLCRPDCAGLCPTCGVDLNETACACAAPLVDPRWAALDQLRTEPDR
jgi:uncharacterized protein